MQQPVHQYKFQLRLLENTSYYATGDGPILFIKAALVLISQEPPLLLPLEYDLRS